MRAEPTHPDKQIKDRVKSPPAARPAPHFLAMDEVQAEYGPE